MKKTFFVSLLTISNLAFAQLPEVTLKDSILIKITEKVLDSIRVSTKEKINIINYGISNLRDYQTEKKLTEEKFGMQAIKVEKFTDFDLVVGFPTNPKVFEFAKPDCYFSYEGVLFFVYLGGESLFKYTKKEKSQVMKMAKSLQSTSISNPPADFWIEVRSKNFKFIPTLTPSQLDEFRIR